MCSLTSDSGAVSDLVSIGWIVNRFTVLIFSSWFSAVLPSLSDWLRSSSTSFSALRLFSLALNKFTLDRLVGFLLVFVLNFSPSIYIKLIYTTLVRIIVTYLLSCK